MDDGLELAELANEEADTTALEDVWLELGQMDTALAELEFRRMFQGELDDSGRIWKSNLVLVERRHRIGQICYCACIYVGPKRKGLRRQ